MNRFFTTLFLFVILSLVDSPVINGQSHPPSVELLEHLLLSLPEIEKRENYTPEQTIKARRGILTDLRSSRWIRAKRYAEKGDLAEAIFEVEKIVPIEQEFVESSSDVLLTTLKLLSGLYERSGQVERAKAILEERIKVVKSDQLDGHHSIVDCRLDLEHLNSRLVHSDSDQQDLAEAAKLEFRRIRLQEEGHLAEATTTAEKCAEIQGRVLGKKHLDYILTIGNLAVYYKLQGLLEKAEPLYLEALSGYEHNLGAKHPSYANHLTNLAEFYRAKADYGKSKLSLLQAIVITKDTLGEDHPNYAVCINNLAQIHMDIGEFEQAELRIQESLEIIKRSFGEEHPRYAAGLNNLAGVYEYQGRENQALSLYIQVSAIQERVLSENHPDFASALNNLARVYGSIANYPEAERIYLRVIDIRRRTLGEAHLDYAQSINELAALYNAQGNDLQAEVRFIESRKIYEEAVGEQHPFYAISLNRLAEFYYYNGNFSEAEPLVLQSLEIFEHTYGREHHNYAWSLSLLARIYESQGNYSESLATYASAREISRRVIGDQHPNYSAVISGLASLYQKLGRYEEALPLLIEIIEISKSIKSDKPHPRHATSLSNLGFWHFEQGEKEAARDRFSESLEIARSHLHASFIGMSQRQQILYLQRLRVGLDVLISVTPPEEIGDCYSGVLDWKAGAWQRRRQERLATEPITQTTNLSPDIAALRIQLSAEIIEMNTARAQHTLFQLEDLEKRFGQNVSEEFKRLDPVRLQAKIPASTVVIDFLEYSHLIPPEEIPGPFEVERRLIAFVTRSGEEVQAVSLGAMQPISEVVAAWRQAIVAREDRVNDAGQKLRKLIWEPVSQLIQSGDTVVFVADGVLHGISLGALPLDRSGTYLLEKHAVATVESVADAVMALEDDPVETNKEGRLLAIGGVSFDISRDKVEPEAADSVGQVSLVDEGFRNSLNSINGSLLEVEEIDRLFRHCFGIESILLTGDEPTESRIKKETSRLLPRYLHFATHGTFMPPESRIRRHMAKIQNRLEQDLEEVTDFHLQDEYQEEYQILQMMPDFWTGVALAGAVNGSVELPDGMRTEDGILNSAEVKNMDLQKTDLVVLSACDSGQGKFEKGEGVIGLRRAFHLAGARTVIASHWSVDDAATSVLMERFYKNLWMHEMSALEALRHSQIWLLNNPNAIKERRKEIERRFPNATLTERPIDLTKELLLPAGEEIKSTNPTIEDHHRTAPWLWGAFVLSGDWR
ncbi:MAG: tetratricopeptide repeat protein [Verrucomicrobiales bacterium]|nr:tetratricopeptide repeat protein [Verrucomicrobiales bacterium]